MAPIILTQNNDTGGSISPPITRTRSHSGLLETSFDEEKGDENQDKTCERRKRRQKVKDFQCQIDASIDFETSEVIDVDDILGDTIDTCDIGTDPAFDDNQELLRSLEDKLRYIKLSQNVKLFHLSLFGLSRRITFSFIFSENQHQPWKQSRKRMLK